MKTDETLVYYSTNTILAHWLNETFYNRKHFVWCSPVFDPSKLDSKHTFSKIPPSSSPHKIYCSFSEDANKNDLHSSKIRENKSGLIKGAGHQLANGVIDDEEYAKIIKRIEKATAAEFKPLLFVIPASSVKGRLKEVDVDEIANPLSVEYQILDLDSTEFDVIEYI